MQYMCSDTASMPATDEVLQRTDVLARIPLPRGQELHLRRRVVLGSIIPPFLDWAAFNSETAEYYLCTPFEETPEIYDAMISALQDARGPA